MGEEIGTDVDDARLCWLEFMIGLNDLFHRNLDLRGLSSLPLVRTRASTSTTACSSLSDSFFYPSTPLSSVSQIHGTEDYKEIEYRAPLYRLPLPG